MSANTTIHTGFWTNQSKGQVLGSTLTLSKSNGAVMVAALAVFIQITGGQSWNMMCFIMHQMRTTTKAQDGIHHQQQAILRNTTNDINTIWQFTKIGYAWRTRSIRSIRRSLTLILIGAIHLLAFAAASILASRITTTGNEVLLSRSDHCGSWQPNSDSPQDAVIAYLSYERLAVEGSSEYINNCLSQAESLPECDVMKVSAPKWNSTKVPCPFDDLCLGTNNTALQMTTSPIDSREDLGINSEDVDRLSISRRATCAPITSDGYMTNGTSYVENTGVGAGYNITFNYTAVHYGQSDFDFATGGLTDPVLQNKSITYLYTNFRQVATEFWNYEATSYDIHTEDNENFVPIPPFSLNNTTLSLIFASYDGVYSGPSDDLWLSAHQESTATIAGYFADGTNLEVQVFAPDRKISTLACAEQFQVCNLRENCTEWVSSEELDSLTFDPTIEGVTNSGKQWMVAQAIMVPFLGSGIGRIVPFLSDCLLANRLANGETSLPPARNQWELEAQNWFSIGLANGQRGVIDHATGPPSEFNEFARNRSFADNNTDLAWVCENQIVRRSDYTSFSTLAIMLVFALSALIILASLWLETLVGHVRSKRRTNRWKQRAWWADGTLQLQRRAFEGIGIGGWEFGEWNKVPTTKTMAWSALRNWDDMLPQYRKVSHGEEPKQDIKKDTIMSTLTPVLSHRYGSLPKRTRSNSV